MLYVPASGTPPPVHGTIDQSGSNRIQVHIVQLLFNLPSGPDVEPVVPSLPEGVCSIHVRQIIGKPCLEQILQRMRRLPLPFVHEPTELPGFRKPDQRMDTIGHDDEPQAEAIASGQLRTQMADDDSFRMIGLKALAAPVAGERDEVNVFLVVIAPPFDQSSPRLPGLVPAHKTRSLKVTLPVAPPPCDLEAAGIPKVDDRGWHHVRHRQR